MTSAKGKQRRLAVLVDANGEVPTGHTDRTLTNNTNKLDTH